MVFHSNVGVWDRKGKLGLTACGGLKRPSDTGALSCLCLLSLWLTVPPIHMVPCTPIMAACLDAAPPGRSSICRHDTTLQLPL